MCNCHNTQRLLKFESHQGPQFGWIKAFGLRYSGRGSCPPVGADRNLIVPAPLESVYNGVKHLSYGIGSNAAKYLGYRFRPPLLCKAVLAKVVWYSVRQMLLSPILA